jgi:thiamine biosynthesis lipoprotein
MGTTVTIDAPGADAALIDRAFEWCRHVEQVCTRFDPASELCGVSAAAPGEPVTCSRLLFEAVQFALHVADISGGAFDPTLGITMQRRGFSREHRSGAIVPTLVDEIGPVSYRDVTLDPESRTITLTRPLLLDLGAVAKGLAVDLAARELRGCGNFAIDAGGDLYLGGVNAEQQPWSVGIRHPRDAGACIAAVRVSDQAVCTSGTYERGHHILDPRDPHASESVASVTVIAASAMLADALATAAFVLGPLPGLAFLEQMGVDGLIVTSDLELIRTPGWPDA